jgi:hypothetical protein
MHMDSALEAIVQAACQPFDKSAVVTDNSFLLIYPPEAEFDVRDMLINRCIPILRNRGVDCDVLDLAGFLFSCFNEEEFADLEAEEFRNYKLMRQGLAARVEKRLISRLGQVSTASPSTNLFVISTAALFPLVRYGEVLRQLRELPCRIFLSFPGEERGGRPHFMNEADGGNYLAVKITIKP